MSIAKPNKFAERLILHLPDFFRAGVLESLEQLVMLPKPLTVAILIFQVIFQRVEKHNGFFFLVSLRP